MLSTSPGLRLFWKARFSSIISLPGGENRFQRGQPAPSVITPRKRQLQEPSWEGSIRETGLRLVPMQTMLREENDPGRIGRALPPYAHLYVNCIHKPNVKIKVSLIYGLAHASAIGFQQVIDESNLKQQVSVAQLGLRGGQKHFQHVQHDDFVDSPSTGGTGRRVGRLKWAVGDLSR